MILTKLRLHGFKSFVDPTELHIAPGLTGVVGPNGCGKSNLLEALRWVMGETSAKSMRGSGMEDVIFAGAATRPARHFAEVSLSIDNSARRAPAAFNRYETLDVIRRITRDAGSAFKANGDDVRARDIRMLFADAATGAHSPALVRQGQISELINAKPTARRSILEDAAGIGGLYQRRHEAELKLNAAETNLGRVADVIEQLDVRLAALARQAKQAARYREIATELRRAEATFLFIRWREADEARLAAEQALAEAVGAVGAAERGALQAEKTREAAEAALPPKRDEEMTAAAILQRLAVERDRLSEREAEAQGALDRLAARIAQIEGDLARETELQQEAAEVIERLLAEEETLIAARAGHDEAETAADRRARATGERLEIAEVEADRLTAEAARLAAAAQAAARRHDETRNATARARKSAEEARAAAAALDDALKEAAARRDDTEETAATARAAAEAAESALAEAETARAEAQAVEAESRAAASAAAGELSAIRAETTALERLLARSDGAKDALLDHIQVAPGYEAALGAALGDDLKAPLTEDGSGWAALPETDAPAGPPAGALPLGDHVTAPPALARRLARVAVAPREAAASMQAALGPGWRLVSVEGDLWRWDGFRAMAEDAPSAAAERLRQRNRLTEMRTALEKAEAAAAAASATHDAMKDRLKAAADDDQARRAARRAAEAAASEAARAAAKAEADLDMASGRREAMEITLARRAEEAKDAEAAEAEAEAARAAVADPEAAWRAAEAAKLTLGAARSEMLSARGEADDLRRAGKARETRLAEASQERASWRARRENAALRVDDLTRRAEESRAEREAASALPGEIRKRREALAHEIERAEARRAAAADALAEAETHARAAEAAAREAEREASAARETRARRETQSEAAAERVREAATRIREEMECAPEALLQRIDAAGDLPAAEALEIEIARLRRQRDSLGAVNLRAEEDAAAASEERDALAREKGDLEAAIAKLRHAIAELNGEGRERLLAAFDEVNSSFSTLFKHLFGGGEANLVLVESDDPLEAGLEIMCMPPGKKLSTLSLLSGGEQTLTALSLIFAVFLANPAPICVLDEVDAPLDDANVGRFCDLLDEMTRRTETRFLIITHHAVTMSRMDRLFGVTMAEQGVSQLVSVDLKLAEAMVAG
ncbi:chromosome segregation protein SMC [Pikeienuella piscinae]|uniref:Chromosome partition protein Smc n=1 Tax=Pikeienuella piscinae TaxID=2748098 RepID=A0A7L5BZD9_9RHOB|nr:chromosome segregation protein SMC [Pikeienuella piscinae]QIE56841.1 chromosome segregation protein SMC [Pikeienuella piscinae]